MWPISVITWKSKFSHFHQKRCKWSFQDKTIDTCCPCNNGSIGAEVPNFVGNNHYCEFGPSGSLLSVLYSNNQVVLTLRYRNLSRSSTRLPLKTLKLLTKTHHWTYISFNNIITSYIISKIIDFYVVLKQYLLQMLSFYSTLVYDNNKGPGPCMAGYKLSILD